MCETDKSTWWTRRNEASPLSLVSTVLRECQSVCPVPVASRPSSWQTGRSSVLFSVSEQVDVGASSLLLLRARVSRSPLPETKPSAGWLSVKFPSSRPPMDLVRLFPASECSRNAVTGRRLAERQSLRGALERRKRRESAHRESSWRPEKDTHPIYAFKIIYEPWPRRVKKLII